MQIRSAIIAAILLLVQSISATAGPSVSPKIMTRYRAGLYSIDSYVHLEIKATTIQDWLPLAKGNSRKDAIDIAKAGHHATLNLYYVPGNPAAPAIVEGEYSARTELKQKITVKVPPHILFISTGIEEQQRRDTDAREQDVVMASQPDAKNFEFTFPPVLKDSIVMYFVDDHFSNEMARGTLQGTSVAIVSLMLPEETYRVPEAVFDLKMDIERDQFSPEDRAHQIFHRKQHDAKATRMAMTEETLAKLRAILQLSSSSCDSNFKN